MLTQTFLQFRVANRVGLWAAMITKSQAGRSSSWRKVSRAIRFSRLRDTANFAAFLILRGPISALAPHLGIPRTVNTASADRWPFANTRRYWSDVSNRCWRRKRCRASPAPVVLGGEPGSTLGTTSFQHLPTRFRGHTSPKPVGTCAL